jgi:hypothetical protein
MRHTLSALLVAAVTLLLALPVQAQVEDTHNCLVVVLDGSGSMAGHKIKQAKKTLKEVLALVPEDTWVSVVVFASRNLQVAYELSPVDQAKLNAAIDGIQVGGGTPLGAAIKAGTDLLLKERDRQLGYGSYQLVVVTDGEASGPGEPGRMQRYAPMVGLRRIRMDVIGVEMPGGKRHWLANTAHSYQSAEDAKELTTALKQAISVEDTTGSAGVSDFDLLSGLPDDVAKSFLGAATSPPRNHPLGTSPVVAKAGKGQASKGSQPDNNDDTTPTTTKQDDGCRAVPGPFLPTGMALFVLMLAALGLRHRRS